MIFYNKSPDGFTYLLSRKKGDPDVPDTLGPPFYINILRILLRVDTPFFHLSSHRLTGELVAITVGTLMIYPSLISTESLSLPPKKSPPREPLCFFFYLPNLNLDLEISLEGFSFPPDNKV